MKIFAIGDMHGNLEVVLKALSEFEVDLLVSTGDWGDPDEIDEETFQAVLSRVHVLTVYGNHDYVDLLCAPRMLTAAQYCFHKAMFVSSAA